MRHLALGCFVIAALLVCGCGGGGTSTAAPTWLSALPEEGPFGAHGIDDVSRAHHLQTYVVFSDGAIVFSGDWIGDVDARLQGEGDAATARWQKWRIVVEARDPNYPPDQNNLRLVITGEGQTFVYNLLPPGA